MLHITDGESVAGTLRESRVPGHVAIYGDLMYEGPAPAGLEDAFWLEVRARFMAEVGYASLEETRQYLKAHQEALVSFPQHDEVVIWLDHRLSDQLILIKVLDWFSRQDLGAVKLSLICVDHYAGIDPFIGLGALTADQLALLIDARTRVNDAQLRAAEEGWRAFTSPDPTDIERFNGGDTTALPFAARALRRHLEQFPATDSGLSCTERQALSVLRAQWPGPLTGPRLFVAVQRQEEAVFMGDSSFYRNIAGLAGVRHPLVQITEEAENRLGDVTITETGLKVLESKADHIDLNGIDVWLGGIHLNGATAAWRWDRTTERLVSHPS